MIKYFSVENYKSIKNKAILEFDSNLGADYPYPASAVVGFAGANASGKTTILQAISFVFWFIQNSDSDTQANEEISCHPFIINSNLPTFFHVLFTKKNSDNNYIDYEYLLEIYQKKVLKEEVYYYLNNSDEQMLVYKREGQQVEFGKTVQRLDNESINDLSEKGSIISFFSQFSSQEIAIEIKNYWVMANVTSNEVKDFNFSPKHFDFSPRKIQGLFYDIERESEQSGYPEFPLLDILGIADIGIKEISLIYKPTTQRIREKLKEFDEIPHPAIRVNEQQRFIDDNLLAVEFKHRIDDNSVSFLDINESAGTLKLLTLLEKIFFAFRYGSLLIIDEIELRLHQNLIAYLIGLFENPSQNLQGGQLLFSFHNTALMEILKPNQLWFTEKNDQGQTEIFSAADFTDIQEIEKRNLEELYRIGRFGAKPRAL